MIISRNTHHSHNMSEEIDPPTADKPNPEPHHFCLHCLLCSCHDQKALNQECQYIGGSKNV